MGPRFPRKTLEVDLPMQRDYRIQSQVGDETVDLQESDEERTFNTQIKNNNETT